ncbi:SPW repeat-containing protein [Nonomuraea maritima]|uniref:SPW repeat-containing protein n=1 Tax=Nonomuraea maritima TaxID=683260 RepID=A0A1G9Q545_9ACTN|nr:SPW repeat protein [Nonomuraea maritima]SDM06069.1 SPW repeat-containing protein [Nonomuraea maritima]
MKAWTRWQDWVTLVAGIYAALSSIWVHGTSGATPSLIVLGILIALTSLVSLANPGVVATEWLNTLWGVLLFVAPWVITYTQSTAASWTSWVVGALTVILSLTAVPASKAAHHHVIQH